MRSTIKGLIACGFSLSLVITLQTLTPGQQATQPSGKPSAANLTSREATLLAMDGRKLSGPEVETLENRLAKDPNDLAARITLLGYYSSQTWSNESARLKKRGHALWFIQNRPDSKLLERIVAMRLDKHLDKDGYEEAKQLWLKQLETYNSNVVVLSNAIDFFLLPDRDLAEKLLKQGAAAEPTEPRWHSRLGQLYALQMRQASDEMRETLAGQRYEQNAQALKLTGDDQLKFYLLADFAKSALEAGEVAVARTSAIELLNQAAKRQQDWNYGNAIHQGHLVLGRLALQSGKTAEAIQHLIEAGKTPGSPGLGSFGPDMTLAKELLEKGERDAVIQYFQLCDTFWTNHAKLQEWTATVKAGGVPEFGANLPY